VTEYKNRIDKLLTEMEKKQKAEKERFRDIMDSCVAMKQQSLICQSQFEDLQSECKKVKEDYDKIKQDMEKPKP
ncbi:jg27332, partial [Pararge aegeria aegeria]